jgi:ribosome-binding factor A
MAKRRRDRQRFVAGSSVGSQANQRPLRVGEEVRHALAKILREGECREPALENTSITVTEVRMSPDLRNATAFVTPLVGENSAEVLAALNRCAAFLRGVVGRKLRLRKTPNLAFVFDDVFDRAERISALLARPEVARDLQPRAAKTEDADDAG